MLLRVAAVVSMLLVTPAQARWLQAESEHFVIYAEDSEKDLIHFGEMLERYHVAMEILTGRETETPSPSNRVTIFVLGNQREVQEAYGGDSRFIAGFYVPRAGMSRAFVPQLRKTGGEPDFSQTVLMHEYAHHFLASTSRFAMPRWLSEGMAEFFASAKQLSGDALQIGRPANHRAGERRYARPVPIRHMLDSALYDEYRNGEFDSFYARSWSLVHYLWFSEGRRNQLNAYWSAVSAGTPSLEAAEAVFGDLDKLDDDLERYVKQRKLTAYTLMPEQLPIGAVTVSNVSEGMNKMLPIVARSQSGVTREEALELLPEAQKIAASYPGDPRVLAALAEAEFDAGNHDAAIAAADRALAYDPAQRDALLQKGLALFDMADEADDIDAGYREAVEAFTALNALEHDHPQPLIHFYMSYVARGAMPSPQAKQALVRAGELAPFDKDIAMQLAFLFAQEGQIAVARQMLSPVASDPHGGNRAQFATMLMERLGTSPEGQPFDFAALARETEGVTGEAPAGDDPADGG
jgi:tetratricopeptide (TPR) repeat protein